MPYTTFDCDTEEGQVYTESEYAVADRIGKSKNLHPFRFGKGSRIDRMFYDDDGKVPMLCEIRTRNKSLKDLCDYQSVLCNEKKLYDGAKLANMLHVDFFLFCRTLKDDQIIWCKIADDKGKFLVNWIRKRDTMQKSCNGGEEEKDVAYIDIGQWTKLKE